MTPTPTRAIRIAILAMGGEGGGVLANWIVDLGEQNGHIAQLTSVPGVAQRTGATIYYIELFPKAALRPGQVPVLAMMPVPGDVDVVVASELMEAGRAVQRGIVTPDRTTLIASTNRVFAMTEKIVMDDGRVAADKLLEACQMAAKRFVGIDMANLAEQAGSVISAVMFGALAGANVLPFAREAFTATITRGGVGVSASLRAFDSGCASAHASDAPPSAPVVDATSPPQPSLPGAAAVIVDRLPATAREFATEGVRRLMDYQDIPYALDYLNRLEAIAKLDRAPNRLTRETARYLALAMSYEDTIRVADLKTRSERFTRVADEVGAKGGQIVEISEYMHPRLQEVAESVPAPLGRFILRNGIARRVVSAFTSSGKTVKTTSLRGFLLLYAVAALKSYRRRTLRFAEEQASIEAWLGDVQAFSGVNYDLACEVVECRNLIKGYGDTLERGRHNYDAILSVVRLSASVPAIDRAVATLRSAALADDTGAKLQAALKRFNTPTTVQATASV